MGAAGCLCFVTSPEVEHETGRLGPHEWFTCPGLPEFEHLQLVRVTMPVQSSSFESRSQLELGAEGC